MNTKNLEKEKDLYQQIIDILEEIIGLCGTKDVEETALDLENSEYEKFEEKKQLLINIIVEAVRKTEQQFDFKPYRNEVSDEEFWETIEEGVRKRTHNFMVILPYRKLAEERRLELLQKAFDTIYAQHENKEFFNEAVKDRVLTDALFEIFRGSEYIVAYMQFSKRRYKKCMHDSVGLQDEDLEYIWKLYQEDFDAAREIAWLNNNVRLESKINYLEQKIEQLGGMLAFEIGELKNELLNYLEQ